MKAARPSAMAGPVARADGQCPADFGRLLAQSLADRWQRYRKALKRCHKKCSEAAVHDLRVATRRLMATLDILGQMTPDDRLQRARRRLKKSLAMFSPLRDVQVQLLAIEAMLPVFPPLQDFYQALGQRERKLVKRLSGRVQKVKTGKVAKAVRAATQDLQALLATPAPPQAEFARAIHAVDQAFNKVVERRRVMNATDTATLHRMRVAFKRFRYMVEALAPALEQVTPTQLKAMNAFQDSMGDIQDIDVLLSSLHAFIDKQPKAAQGSFTGACEELCRQRAARIEAFLQEADTLFTFWAPKR